ncbi:MAG: hypothetical protein ACI9FJ_002506 [Alteromonadaceae bacterium]|jgi:hypothetical protein
MPDHTTQSIPEDRSRLLNLQYNHQADDINCVISALKKDQVVLVQGIEPDEANQFLFAVSSALGLGDALALQSTFASSLGHRDNVGDYFMSVNKRKDYQFVTPHSEGGSFGNIQLASFYGYENTTDGGESILMNVDQSSDIWPLLREKTNRGMADRPLTDAEINQLKVMARVNMPEDTLSESDEILSQRVLVPGFTLFEVLAKLRKSYSKILDQNIHAYWDAVECVDFDSALQFNDFLTQNGLLKQLAQKLPIEMIDVDAPRRVRHLGCVYDRLFSSKITHKLQPGELVIQNNLSWTHSVNNWTPGSGTRKVVGAFA